MDGLVKGTHEIPLSVLTQLKEAFDVSSLPFVVNLSDYHSISETFFNLIDILQKLKTGIKRSCSGEFVKIQNQILPEIY